MKHTPGPWFIWADQNNRLQVGSSTNYSVAQMWVTPLEGQETNAKLIAAAPVMLDRLTLIENLATQVCDAINKRDAIAYEETLSSIKMLAREAIVEATDKGYHSFNQRGNSV